MLRGGLKRPAHSINSTELITSSAWIAVSCFPSLMTCDPALHFPLPNGILLFKDSKRPTCPPWLERVALDDATLYLSISNRRIILWSTLNRRALEKRERVHERLKIDRFLYAQPGVSILTWLAIDLLSREISLRAAASSWRTAAHLQEQKARNGDEGAGKR